MSYLTIQEHFYFTTRVFLFPSRFKSVCGSEIFLLPTFCSHFEFMPCKLYSYNEYHKPFLHTAAQERSDTGSERAEHRQSKNLKYSWKKRSYLSCSEAGLLQNDLYLSAFLIIHACLTSHKQELLAEILSFVNNMFSHLSLSTGVTLRFEQQQRDLSLYSSASSNINPILPSLSLFLDLCIHLLLLIHNMLILETLQCNKGYLV